MAQINIVVGQGFQPFLSPEEYSRQTGISLATVKKKMHNGELPCDKLNLTETRNGSPYINMVRLLEMAASSQYKHPRLNQD